MLVKLLLVLILDKTIPGASESMVRMCGSPCESRWEPPAASDCAVGYKVAKPAW